jgi:uncharacterized integral membrane protein
MNRKLGYALIMIALVVVILLMNHAAMSLDLIVTEIRAPLSMILLAFTAVGVIIGLLLK